MATCLVGIVACAVPFQPPTPAPKRTDAGVAAPFDKTWDAIIEIFARDVITVETLDKSSGFIVASQAVIPSTTKRERDAALRLADCGRNPIGVSNPEVQIAYPVSAKYNVLVKPQSAGASSILVSARFLGKLSAGGDLLSCESKGLFESNLEGDVKRRAEGK